MNYRDLVRTLQKENILPNWTQKQCPRCGYGKLGKLKYVKCRKAWLHQCSSRTCHKYLQPHDFHPIFFQGSGNSHTSLNVQASILYAAVAGVPVNSTHLVLDTDHKPIERIFKNLDVARAMYVDKEEKSITYGGTRNSIWKDVEADEVDVGKAVDEAALDARQALKWEQSCGVVERGRPSSLRLYRLNPPCTKARAPGPGPIRKEEWRKIGSSVLRDRHVVLHTDGARAYKLRIPGVHHCHVVHKKKKMIVNKKVRISFFRQLFCKIYCY